jgi:hypothetical protein
MARHLANVRPSIDLLGFVCSFCRRHVQRGSRAQKAQVACA